MITLAQSQTSYAAFLPAIFAPYAEFAVTAQAARPLPDCLVPSDLDFLNHKSSLFHLHAALFSAGQAIQSAAPNMVTRRDRGRTSILGDSGGYQVITGQLKDQSGKRLGSAEACKHVLPWLDAQCDWAMTLDIPSRSVFVRDSGYYGDFKRCLGDTVANLKYFEGNRNGGTKFCNVLQGNTSKELRTWYNAIRGFHFDGWAFGGAMRDDLYYVLRLIILMRDQNVAIGDRLHFLGIGRLDMACLFTSLQSELRKDNPNLSVSFDCATPFLLTGKYKKVIVGAKLDAKGFTLDTRDIPFNGAYIGDGRAFPFDSPVGNRLTMGDLCVREDFSASRWDMLSSYLVINHNVFTHVKAVADANRLYDLEREDIRLQVSHALLEAKDAIQRVLREENAMQALDKAKRYLQQFRQAPETAEADLLDERGDHTQLACGYFP